MLHTRIFKAPQSQSKKKEKGLNLSVCHKYNLFFFGNADKKNEDFFILLKT
jgi:hypothetical protein